MIESPLIQEMRAQTRHEDILQILEKRFGVVPPELALAIRAEINAAKLFELHGEALACLDLASFQARLGA